MKNSKIIKKSNNNTKQEKANKKELFKEKIINKFYFLKQFYYSVFKINKYNVLLQDGFIKSFKYMLKLLLILGLIYAIILSTTSQKNMYKLREYLSENLPDLTYENNEITTNIEERIILDNELVKVNFGGQIIIDTNTDYETLVEEYLQKEEPSILLTKEFFTIIKPDSVYKAEYKEVLKKYLGQEIKRIDKEELLYLFDEYSFSQILLACLISYIITNLIVVIVYCTFFTAFGFIICKVMKIRIKIFEIFTMGIYAMTLSILGYFSLYFIPLNYTNPLRIALIVIPMIYLGRAIYVNKWIIPDMVNKK